MPYGPEGVGKSTLGAKSDRPIFITPEGGVDQLTDANDHPCEEMPNIISWDDLTKAIVSLSTEQHNFKTLVLDSADWIEGLCHQKIIGTSGKTITTVNGGYGAGYRAAQNMHQDLIKSLEALRERKGMNIIVTAHAHVKAVKDPEMNEDYDAFEIKCHEFVSSLWREWVDGLFFIRFKTFVKSAEANDTKRARAFSDGSRVLYTIKQPSFQAKNRYGLPPEMEFTQSFWNDFMQYAKREIKQESLDEVKAEITELIQKIPDEPTKTAAMNFIRPDMNIAQLTAVRGRLRQVTAQKGA